MALLRIEQVGNILSFGVSERILYRGEEASVIRITQRDFRRRFEEFRAKLRPEMGMMISEIMRPKNRDGRLVTSCTVEVTHDKGFPDRLLICLWSGFWNGPQAREKLELIINYIRDTLGIAPNDVVYRSSIA